MATRSLSRVTAAILAGGLGSRLRPAVADRPKVMAEVEGRPFLTFLLDQLADAGLEQIILCTGYLGEQIRGTIGHSYAGLHLCYSQESTGLGTAGALRLAQPLIQSDAVLVMNGDSFCSASLDAFCDWHGANDADASVILTRVADARRYGRVRTDAKGRVLGFEEKGDAIGPDWINAGIYLFKTGLLHTIASSGPQSLERDVLPTWVKGRFFGYRSEAAFIDIGTPESYAKAALFLAPRGRMENDSICPLRKS